MVVRGLLLLSWEEIPTGRGEVCPEEPVVVAEAEWLGFVPDETQQAVLRGDTRRLILLCSRQWGKSTVAAALAARRAMERAGALVVCVSPTLKQTEEFLLKVREMVERAGVLGGRAGRLGFRLKNGARVMGLPKIQANLRGYSKPALVVIDEAAQVPDTTYRAVRPLLVHGGDLALLSTPFGRQGFFWEEWANGGPEWTRVEVKATECERISAAFLAEERRAMGEDWFAQEYLCSFLGRGGLFRQQWLDAAVQRGLDRKALEFQFPWDKE